jgi:hypothetical protein
MESDRVKLQKSYVRKFDKILPSKKVFRYFQAENKIDTVINVKIAEVIPLEGWGEFIEEIEEEEKKLGKK